MLSMSLQRRRQSKRYYCNSMQEYSNFMPLMLYLFAPIAPPQGLEV